MKKELDGDDMLWFEKKIGWGPNGPHGPRRVKQAGAYEHAIGVRQFATLRGVPFKIAALYPCCFHPAILFSCTGFQSISKYRVG